MGTPFAYPHVHTRKTLIHTVDVIRCAFASRSECNPRLLHASISLSARSLLFCRVFLFFMCHAAPPQGASEWPYHLWPFLFTSPLNWGVHSPRKQSNAHAHTHRCNDRWKRKEKKRNAIYDSSSRLLIVLRHTGRVQKQHKDFSFIVTGKKCFNKWKRHKGTAKDAHGHSDKSPFFSQCASWGVLCGGHICRQPLMSTLLCFVLLYAWLHL